jgi:hypothetical protein
MIKLKEFTMKRILIIVAIFVTVLSFDNEQTMAQSAGLVVYYPFNGNTNDASGNAIMERLTAPL